MSARSKSKKIVLTSAAPENSDGCGRSMMTVSCSRYSITAAASLLVGDSVAWGAAAAPAAIGAGPAVEESFGVRAHPAAVARTSAPIVVIRSAVRMVHLL